MEANTVAVTGDVGVEETSPQLVLLDIPSVSTDPNPPALADSERWFDILANKFAEHKAKIGDALYGMGHLLLDAKKTFRYGEWLKFLNDPRVGVSERDAQRIMKIARQIDGERLAALGVSKATMLIEAMRKPEDRERFLNDHGDLAQVPERDLRAMLKPPKPSTPTEEAGKKEEQAPNIDFLPPEIGEMREYLLQMPAAEAVEIVTRLFGMRFKDLPNWATFLVLGMFIATPAAVKAHKYEGPLQVALDAVNCEKAIDAELEKMLRDARAWLLAGIDSQLSVVNWWDRGGPFFGWRELKWLEQARENAVLDARDAAEEIARKNVSA